MRRAAFTAAALTAIAAATMAAALHMGQAGAQTAAPADVAPDPLGEKTGGETTVWATGKNAFSFPAANLTDPERTRFVIGNSFFKRNWVESPASTTARDGLGPHFVARSCGACHLFDGRGEPPPWKRGISDEEPLALLMRLSVPGTDAKGGPRHDPVYGDQLNTSAVQNVKPEARVRLRWAAVKGRFADGTPYTLQKPEYIIDRLAYGPLAQGAMLSPRIAPQVIGVGLLEAIAERDILANAEAQAALPGPIKGQANRVWDAFAQREMVGRFGWKANVATIAHQTAGAFHGDIGITSAQHPQQTCTPTQKDCLAAPHGGTPDEPEIDDKTLGEVVFYQATLAPPARRNAQDPTVQRGQALFAQAQCAVCHRPSYTTAEGPFPHLTSKALQGQTIHPYTDLLLHDMGEALADGRPDFLANGRQWKTPALWGIGLIKDVNGHTRLLHDGRADGVLEAILWHGGEAEESKQRVLKFSEADRQALVKFVESL
ncbi:MAG: c-type cytochrome [Hydrogenophaga sp.]|nr:c-type cytochrome [Hydrogenophaga sp.]NIN24775.1 c-type cytochrome [Hydrogenophaga sp.]NIN29287.1 c-type cytochrome [Hydrogenophaga sp.]NIN53810.1 c-type cytochrome [Hydrogenophaga sp.]NIO53190.1 c-type cytochrome [Hydrogenophaga sp.]